MKGFKSILAVFKTGFADGEFRALLYLAVSTIVVGSLFYYFHEGWTYIDSLFFSVVTLTTVGYGNLIPSTTFSKLFTIVFVLMGVGLILAFITKVAQIVERGMRD